MKKLSLLMLVAVQGLWGASRMPAIQGSGMNVPPKASSSQVGKTAAEILKDRNEEARKVLEEKGHNLKVLDEAKIKKLIAVQRKIAVEGKTNLFLMNTKFPDKETRERLEEKANQYLINNNLNKETLTFNHYLRIMEDIEKAEVSAATPCERRAKASTLQSVPVKAVDAFQAPVARAAAQPVVQEQIPAASSSAAAPVKRIIVPAAAGNPLFGQAATQLVARPEQLISIETLDFSDIAKIPGFTATSRWLEEALIETAKSMNCADRGEVIEELRSKLEKKGFIGDRNVSQELEKQCLHLNINYEEPKGAFKKLYAAYRKLNANYEEIFTENEEVKAIVAQQQKTEASSSHPGKSVLTATTLPAPVKDIMIPAEVVINPAPSTTTFRRPASNALLPMSRQAESSNNEIVAGHKALARDQVKEPNIVISAVEQKEAATKELSKLNILNTTHEVAKLVAIGADINALNCLGRPLLYRALETGTVEDVNQILTYNPETNIIDTRGFTAIHLALEFKKKELFDILVARKEININARDKHGISVLDKVIRLGDIERFKSLLKNRTEIDINAKDNDKMTSLHKIIYRFTQKGIAYKDITEQRLAAAYIRLLVEAGADVLIKDPLFDKTPLEILELNNYTNQEVLQLLRKA